MDRRFRGELLEPSHPGYEEARRAWNAMVDNRPALIVKCRDTQDVAAALAVARDRGLEVSVRGGGHSIVGHSVTDGGVMIDLSPLNDVRIEPESRRARVGGGAVWADVDRAAQEVGLAVTGGLVSHTGVGGLSLGGGYGWLARRHGLSCDNLVCAEVVTASGDVLTASDDENDDLLWGLRGGGGNFGVVTKFEFQLHEFDGRCQSVDVFYAAENGSRALRAFRDFVADAPLEATAIAHVGTARSLPFLPDEWHGQPLVILSVVFLGGDDEGLRVAAPLRQAATPVAEVVEPMDYLALQAQVDASQEHGLRRYWKSHFISELPDSAVDAFLEAGLAAAQASPVVGAELVSLGGAISQVGEHDTAFGHRATAFDFLATAGWVDPGEDDFQMTTARRVGEAMAPYGDGAYVNGLTNEGEDRVRWAYGPEKYDRLVALKDKYDPSNVFHLNQNVRPSNGAA
jgi:FAD/FMN-containing dehydrogenase